MIAQWLTFFTEHEKLLWVLGASSLIAFIATLLIVPWIIIRLPADYFVATTRHSLLAENLHPFISVIILILKNTLGMIIILAGIVMLLIPGQGLLSILIGVLMIDFPGKFKFERWLVQNKTILRSINWLRTRKGKEALILDPD